MCECAVVREDGLVGKTLALTTETCNHDCSLTSRLKVFTFQTLNVRHSELITQSLRPTTMFR